MLEKILIVGLGNPGYEKTIHNIGSFIIKNHLKNIETIKKSNYMINKYITNIYYYDGGYSSGNYYMNDSGIPIKEIINFNNIKPENTYVIYDDIRIQLGKYQIIEGAMKSYGHNGLKSIINNIGNSFTLVRIGVGPKPELLELKDFVLSKIPASKLLIIENIVNEVFLEIYALVKNKFKK
jgi:PTH1 family peptidyl-tRNA hydrolase